MVLHSTGRPAGAPRTARVSAPQRALCLAHGISRRARRRDRHAWNDRGVKTNEEFYYVGRQVGWAIYVDGRLHYWNEQILDEGRPVASKKFEAGRWRLAFNCGETVSRAIDERERGCSR